MTIAKDDQYITKKELDSSLTSFGKGLVEQIVGEIRQELDSKLAAQEKRIIQHTDELLTEQSLELTSAMSDMVVPLQKVDTDHEHRIAQLEQQAA